MNEAVGFMKYIFKRAYSESNSELKTMNKIRNLNMQTLHTITSYQEEGLSVSTIRPETYAIASCELAIKLQEQREDRLEKYKKRLDMHLDTLGSTDPKLKGILIKAFVDGEKVEINLLNKASAVLLKQMEKERIREHGDLRGMLREDRMLVRQDRMLKREKDNEKQLQKSFESLGEELKKGLKKAN